MFDSLKSEIHSAIGTVRANKNLGETERAIFTSQLTKMLDHISVIQRKIESFQTNQDILRDSGPMIREMLRYWRNPGLKGFTSGKLAAMAYIREETGWGVKEAKNFVDQFGGVL